MTLRSITGMRRRGNEPEGGVMWSRYWRDKEPVGRCIIILRCFENLSTSSTVCIMTIY
jgi:hypothetical protein